MTTEILYVELTIAYRKGLLLFVANLVSQFKLRFANIACCYLSSPKCRFTRLS